jgi:adenine C2-methylase RlmN of 23S rRNA A2503 and tRNA A37
VRPTVQGRSKERKDKKEWRGRKRKKQEVKIDKKEKGKVCVCTSDGCVIRIILCASQKKYIYIYIKKEEIKETKRNG